MISGIFAIGYAKPERSIDGKTKRKTDIIASCWVEDMVEINSPIPRVVNK